MEQTTQLSPDQNLEGPRVHNRAAWTTVFIASLFTIVSLVDRNAISIMIPEIKAEFHLTDFQVSIIQGLSFATFYCLGGILIGGLVDRWSKRWIMFGGMTTWSLAMVWGGLAATYKELFASRMLVGAGEGTVSPCSTTLISGSFPPNRMSFPMSVMTSAGVLGLGLSFALGGWLLEYFSAHPIGSISPWRQVLIALGLPGVAVALLVFLMREPQLPTMEHDRRNSSWRACCDYLLSHKRAVGGPILTYGLVVLIGQSAAAWAPTYARRVLGISAGEIGQSLLILVGVGGLIGMTGMGLLVDRLGARNFHDAALRCLLCALCIGVPCGAIGFLVDNRFAFYASILIIQLTILSSAGTLYAALHIVTPYSFRGRMTAICTLVITLFGYAVGPIAVGMLTDFIYKDEKDVGLSIASLIIISGLLLIFLILIIMPQYRRLHMKISVNQR